MCDLSILISSLNKCDAVIDLINSYPNRGLSYEIIVCSDDTTKNLPNVKYVPDPHTSVTAFNHCYSLSEGGFVFVFPGTVIPPSNMFDMVDFLDNAEYKVSSFSDDFGRSCLAPDWSASMFGLSFRPQILRFPVFHKNFINNYLDGVIFNESFKHHWVDNWLSIFCGRFVSGISENNNFRIKTIPHTSITSHDDHDLFVFKTLLETKPSNYNYRIKT